MHGLRRADIKNPSVSNTSSSAAEASFEALTNSGNDKNIQFTQKLDGSKNFHNFNNSTNG